MDIYASPLTTDELRSLWLFYSSNDQKLKGAKVMSFTDFRRLLSSIHEQDVGRPGVVVDAEFAEYVIKRYLKASSGGITLQGLDTEVSFAEFCGNFNAYWAYRKGIYDEFKSRVGGRIPRNSDLPKQENSEVQGQTVSLAQNPGSSLSPTDTSKSINAEVQISELSEKVRLLESQLREESRRKNDARDELDDLRSRLNAEKLSSRELSAQLSYLEDDKLSHDAVVKRLRDEVARLSDVNESIQLELDRTGASFRTAKDKYEILSKDLQSELATSRQRIEQLEKTVAGFKETGQVSLKELEMQNISLRSMLERYRRTYLKSSGFEGSGFADDCDAMASKILSCSGSGDSEAAVVSDSDGLPLTTVTINKLVDCIDRSKFLAKRIDETDSTAVSNSTWKDLCLAQRTCVMDMFDIFSKAIKSSEALKQTRAACATMADSKGQSGASRVQDRNARLGPIPGLNTLPAKVAFGSGVALGSGASSGQAGGFSNDNSLLARCLNASKASSSQPSARQAVYESVPREHRISPV